MRLQNEGKMNKTPFQKLLNNSVQLSVADIGTLLEDFINKRKNAILMKHVPISISPEDLLNKLELDLRSIRSIFDYRVKAIKSENKLIKKASHLIKSEIFEQYLQEREYASRGYHLRTATLDALEVFQERGSCDYCLRNIVSPGSNQSDPVSVFMGCGHTFHQHCVNIYHKESKREDARCPKCTKDGKDLSLEQVAEAANRLLKPRAVSVKENGAGGGQLDGDQRNRAELGQVGVGGGHHALERQTTLTFF